MIREVKLGKKKYLLLEAVSEEEKSLGLMGVKKLPKREGMIFVYDEPEDVVFWMKDTEIPLDIIFIDEYEEVVKVVLAIPFDESPISASDIKYVVELNTGSGVSIGDELDFLDEEDEPETITTTVTMVVIAPDGESLMDLEGGERIFSREATRGLIKRAKKAKALEEDTVKYEKACKALGKYLFKELDKLDSRDPEYVTK